jgi:hypothetical protein
MKHPLRLPAAAARTLVISGLLTAGSAFGQVTVSAYFGFNQSQIPAALVNAVDAFNTGASASRSILLNNVANAFTLTFTDGPNSGTASFTVVDNYGTNLDVNNNQVLRQFVNSIEGPNTSAAGQLVVTLTSVSNLSSLSLTRVQVTGGGSSQYTAVLPDGSTSLTENASISATWAQGQSLTISNQSASAATMNIQGLSFSGTPMPIPEPSSVALLGGLFAVGFVAVRRRR